MKKRKGYIVFYTSRPFEAGSWTIGNLSFIREGGLFGNIYPNEQWVFAELKRIDPNINKIVITNIIELPIRKFNKWKGYTN